MAYDGIEVEIKIPIDKEAVQRIKALLEDVGAQTIHQLDHYFDCRNRTFLNSDPIEEWLSVRSRGLRTLVNHKRFHFDVGGVATHCDEVEIEVTNMESAFALLNALGYQELIVVDKLRTEGIINDSFSVSIDEVQTLGHFVEIEAMKSLGTISDTRGALESFARDILQVDLVAIDHQGYPLLMLKNSGLRT